MLEQGEINRGATDEQRSEGQRVGLGLTAGNRIIWVKIRGSFTYRRG